MHTSLLTRACSLSFSHPHTQTHRGRYEAELDEVGKLNTEMKSNIMSLTASLQKERSVTADLRQEVASLCDELERSEGV